MSQQAAEKNEIVTRGFLKGQFTIQHLQTRYDKNHPEHVVFKLQS